VILLTGGAGFIGSNIAADLDEAGRTDVVIADTLGHDAKWRNIAKRRIADFVFPEEIEAYLAGRPRADAVIHMGAVTSTTATDADAVVRANIRLSIRLWDWCARTGTPFLYASSAATYGDGSAGFADDEAALGRLRPLNLYAWSKHAFDRWAVERARVGDAPPQWAGLKFFNVYGPNEYHKGDMQSLVARNHGAVRDGAPVRLFKSHRAGLPDGGQSRDFVYVRDCAAVVGWLLRTPAVSGLFNVGTGTARSFRALIEALAAAVGRPATIAYVDMPEALRAQYQDFTCAEPAKLRRAGYESAFRSIEEGVGEYTRSHLSTGDPFR
jgi:ADP-L-glycero-D-manno-heptose 6-epimerase